MNGSVVGRGVLVLWLASLGCRDRQDAVVAPPSRAVPQAGTPAPAAPASAAVPAPIDAGTTVGAIALSSWPWDLARLDAATAAALLATPFAKLIPAARPELGSYRNDRRGAPDQPAVPTSCAHYLELSAGGYAFDGPASEAGLDDALHRTCGALKRLAIARAATQSFLAGFDIGRDGLAALPRRVCDNWETLSAEKVRALPREALGSERGLQPNREGATARSLTACRKGDDGDRTCCRLEEVARADVDGDGIEDLLLFSTLGSGGPSMETSNALYTLTRREPAGVLELLSED